MKINSKQKGNRGEREGAKEWAKVMGCEARRGQQYSGSPDSPDIVQGIKGTHCEVKRVEKFKLYEALEQAEADKAPEEIPVVLHRRNLKQWVVVVNLDDLPKLAKIISEYQNEKKEESIQD